MARNRVKNKLVFNISCALLILIASFLVIYLLAGRNSYSIDNALTWDGVSVASSFSHDLFASLHGPRRLPHTPYESLVSLLASPPPDWKSSLIHQF